MVLAAPHPDYREMHVYREGAEMIRDFNMSFHPAGALFKEVFDAYPCVYVKHVVPHGVMKYRLQRQTPVKQALESLGHGGRGGDRQDLRRPPRVVGGLCLLT